MKTRYFVLGVFVAALGLGVFTVVRLNGLSTREEPTAAERVLARATRRWATSRGGRTAVNPCRSLRTSGRSPAPISPTLKLTSQ
jgi:hypothetical protein